MNEIDPEAGIETDPGVLKLTVVAPVTADETTIEVPVPLDVRVRAPLRVAAPERVTTALLALEVRVSEVAVVVAETVMPVAVASETVTAPPAVTVPPTVIDWAPVGLMRTAPVVAVMVPVAEKAPVRTPLRVTEVEAEIVPTMVGLVEVI